MWADGLFQDLFRILDHRGNVHCRWQQGFPASEYKQILDQRGASLCRAKGSAQRARYSRISASTLLYKFKVPGNGC
jgi:hypothetical protein